jgi:amino acid transporter
MSADCEEARGLARGIVGSARVTAFGASIVAPAASAVTVLVIVISYAGFASPLVVLITFAGSLCCALSIAEFARRVPSAGWAYTYNSRGLGPTAGFLTGWMMIFGYALFVPAGIALTSMYASHLLSNDVFHAAVSPSALFVVILAAVALLAYLGIGTTASVDLLLVAGEMGRDRGAGHHDPGQDRARALLAGRVLPGFHPARPAHRDHRRDDLRHQRLRRLRGRRRAG